MVVHRIFKVLGALQHGGIIGKSGKSGKNSRIWGLGHRDKYLFGGNGDGDER
jgi:hypothetical protein